MGRMHGSLSRPAILFKKKDRKATSPNPILKPLNKVIVWFDSSYPHSIQSGYEFMLRDKFPTYPFRIENNFTEACRLLNTAMANCQYILIISGPIKNQLLDCVYKSGTITAIYIIEPLLIDSHGLDCYSSKSKLCRTFKEMLNLLEESLIPIPISKPLNCPVKPISYALEPDHCLMSEQTVKAIAYEKKQQEDQMQYRYAYYMTIYLIKQYFDNIKQKYDQTNDIKLLENPLLENCAPYLQKVSEENIIDSFEAFRELLKIALLIDQQNFTYIPKSIETSKSHVGGSYRTVERILKLMKLPLKFNNALLAYKNDLFHPKVRKIADKLQETLLALVLEMVTGRTKDENSRHLWSELALNWSVLSDLDICIKVFIELLFEFSEKFADFSETLTKSLVMSDYRFNILKEIQERMIKKADEHFEKSPEYEAAMDAYDIENAVFFVDVETMEEICNEIQDKFICPFIFSSVSEFGTSSLEKFKHSPLYFVVDNKFTQCDYGQLLNICIKNSITPILIVLIISDEIVISKEQLRRPWTVTQYFAGEPYIISQYMSSQEMPVEKEVSTFDEYYKDFKSTLSLFGNKSEGIIENEKQELNENELEAGWEMNDKIDEKVMSKMVSELTLGQKTVGSLHFYTYSFYKEKGYSNLYWDKYCKLFGASSKYLNIFDVCFGKNLLKAYTLQTQPPFYKMLNDAFRGGNPEKISKFRAFFVMLHDLVRKNLLLQYTGTVFRGTYFNEKLLANLKIGSKFVSTMFTSTSKNPTVAYEFANKGNKNVILEIELNDKAYSNVDIHKEECSILPEEQEVLLLPFSSFEVKRIFKEGKFTYITLIELIPDEKNNGDNIKSVEFYN